MSNIKIGLQLYSVRDKMQESVEDTLRAVKEMGYDYVEFAGYFDHTAEELAALPDPQTDAAESTPPSTEPLEKPWSEISLPVAIGICLLPNVVLVIVLLVRKIRHKIASKYMD